MILPGGWLKETDLIYEGIATLPKALSVSVSGKETDLIYEGIATYLGAARSFVWLARKKLT